MLGDMSKFVPAQIAPRDAYQRPGQSVFGQVRAAASTSACIDEHGWHIMLCHVHVMSCYMLQICFYALDRLTPLYAHTAYTLRADLAVIQRAVNIVTHATEPLHVYAMTTEPGHHASYQSYGEETWESESRMQ